MSEFVGLEPLKQQFLQFARMAVLDERRRNLSRNASPQGAMHFVFEGNPGTGKTTFARTVAGKYKHCLDRDFSETIFACRIYSPVYS